MPCLEHLAQLREREAVLAARGVRVMAVTFESAERVREYREREPISYPILRDPERVAYRAFGLQRRERAASIWRPKTSWYYVKNMVRGRLPRVARADYYQLGGDVLLSPSGAVCWVYRSQEPADRPSVELILKEVGDCHDD